MNITTRNKVFFGLVAFVIAASAGSVFFACSPAPKTQTAAESLAEDNKLDGKQLAAKYCVKCHDNTSPDLLTKDVWNYHTLPSMATLMGISTYGNSYFKSDSAKGISIVNWDKIVDYYLKSAPVQLEAQKRPDSLINDWAGFTLKLPAPGQIDHAFTTTVSFDSINHQLYSSDGGTLKIYKWSAGLKPKSVAEVITPVVNIENTKGSTGASEQIITSVGVLGPMDYPNGRILSADLNNTKPDLKPVETDLSRPLYTSAADFNKDGLTDYAVAVNGGIKGSLIWMKQNADKTFSRMVIKKPCGPVQVLTGDFNSDGWPDIMALYGSGNEGLSLFTNNKKGSFTEKELLTFPPTYGSSSFQLTDINHDGKPDLVYTSGYNYRDSRILKPYNGLYIYLNTGDWNFKQSYFYPINGCTKAIAADFDGDGDIDIATSAFFADLKNQPAESFIYFEQDGAMHFKPHAIPVSKYGRWFTMDSGDVNGDGKKDIILGNYSTGLSISNNINPNNNGNIPLIVLENHIKK